MRMKEFGENLMIKQNGKENPSQWYNLRPILGYANWAMIFILLGARETGKSYAVTNFFVDQFVNKGIPFVWLRLTERQSGKLLQNNAERLVDPDIRRKYNLDLVTSGPNVYQVTKRSEPDKNGKTKIVEKKLMARVLNLSTFYTDKGSIFDKDFLNDPTMRYNIAVDEFQREKNEKNTFDILYALTNQLENLVRSTKERVRVFFMGNTLEEASDILCAFNFIPEQFGLYKLKKKRAIIHYIRPSNLYLERRKGSLADLLMPTASTFTNQIEADKTLVTKQRLTSPMYIVKFSKDPKDWFTVWNNNVVCKYNKEKGKPVIAMRPYLDDLYTVDRVKAVIETFDTRSYQYRSLLVFKQFQNQLSLLKPRNG